MRLQVKRADAVAFGGTFLATRNLRKPFQSALACSGFAALEGGGLELATATARGKGGNVRADNKRGEESGRESGSLGPKSIPNKT